MVDTIDSKIIEALKLNSRQSFAEIGRQIHLSPSSVRERIQKLEEQGIITGYSLKLDQSKLGMGIEAFITLKLYSGKLKVFMNDVASLTEVSEAYRITGTQNIHMKVALKDQLQLQHFIDKMINYGDPITSLILSRITS